MYANIKKIVQRSRESQMNVACDTTTKLIILKYMKQPHGKE